MSTAVLAQVGSAYGATELKEYIRKHTVRGFVTAIALALLLFLLHFAVTIFLNRKVVLLRAPLNKLKLSNLAAPPTDAPPPPPPPEAAGPAARAGIPVPVPDAMIAPDVKDFANTEELSTASTTGGDGNDTDWMSGVGTDIGTTTKEEIPDPDEFVSFEQEPTVADLTDLQKLVKYPPTAIKMGIEGKVTVNVLVDKNGHPKEVRIVSSDNSMLDAAAKEAASKYTGYRPGIQNGVPQMCWISVPITFRLR